MLRSVSVGETLAAIPLVRALRHRCPALPICDYNDPTTGSERVQSARQRRASFYLPYDLPGFSNRFIIRWILKLVIITGNRAMA